MSKASKHTARHAMTSFERTQLRSTLQIQQRSRKRYPGRRAEQCESDVTHAAVKLADSTLAVANGSSLPALDVEIWDSVVTD